MSELRTAAWVEMAGHRISGPLAAALFVLAMFGCSDPAPATSGISAAPAAGCSLDVTRCVDSTLQTCVEVDGVGAWSDTPCDADLFCVVAEQAERAAFCALSDQLEPTCDAGAEISRGCADGSTRYDCRFGYAIFRQPCQFDQICHANLGCVIDERPDPDVCAEPWSRNVACWDDRVLECHERHLAIGRDCAVDERTCFATTDARAFCVDSAAQDARCAQLEVFARDGSVELGCLDGAVATCAEGVWLGEQPCPAGCDSSAEGCL